MSVQHAGNRGKSEKEDSHRGLKAVVIGMGVMLIGGLVLLFVLAYQKMTNPEKFAKPVVRAKSECNMEAKLALPEGNITEVMTFEKSLSFQIETEAGLVWISIDRCHGDELSRITISR
jgi:hypothetical protein